MTTGARTYMRPAFVAVATPEAETACKALSDLYGRFRTDEADVVVVLGGDGLMLRTLHARMDDGTPVFGMNLGSVGFLMNDYREERLLERLAAAELTTLHPLRMRAVDRFGDRHDALAINEVSLLRETVQTAKLEISIDGRIRMDTLLCDGLLLATPAGSTAYNLSAHGPIIPLGANLLALTPISAFRPRRWRGALLPKTARVSVRVLEAEKRPVSVAADHSEHRDVRHVDVAADETRRLSVLFDRARGLDERILAEQFAS